MNNPLVYQILADAVLLLHTLFVVFVITGLILVIVGGIAGWRWIRNPWFRSAHLAAIAIVVLQAWMGVWCPLTILEMMLRQRAGDVVYSGSFIAYWLNSLLYYEAPLWVFTLVYTIFGTLVAVAWLWIRPMPFKRLRR